MEHVSLTANFQSIFFYFQVFFLRKVHMLVPQHAKRAERVSKWKGINKIDVARKHR